MWCLNTNVFISNNFITLNQDSMTGTFNILYFLAEFPSAFVNVELNQNKGNIHIFNMNRHFVRFDTNYMLVNINVYGSEENSTHV